jgi:hypothetical protein
VTFCLPDDSSVGSSVSGSLLLCDVETMESSIHTDRWGTGEDFGNQSCCIVLPFMDGLDSDDDFALDDEGDESDDGSPPPTRMEDWFNSANELGLNFDALDDDGVFSQGYQTPSCRKTSDDEGNMGKGEICKSVEPLTLKGLTEMQTPVAKGIPIFPILDDVQETPVASNLHSALSEPEDEANPVLPTLTPLLNKEEHSEGVKVTKGSPMSVVELDESIFKKKDTTQSNAISDNDDLSIDLEQYAERLTSIHLGTDDIAVRDLSQLAVTSLISNKINVPSSMVASPISSGHYTVSSPECRHVALPRSTFKKPGIMPHWKVLESIPGSKPTAMVSPPSARTSLERPIASSPLTRTLTKSPIGRMKVRHPGRGS